MGCVVKIRCEGKWLGQEMVAVAVGGGADGLGRAWVNWVPWGLL